MTWKAIGGSVAGTSHINAGKGCEDALQYRVIQTPGGDEVLICACSDGAGSAIHAQYASACCTEKVMAALSKFGEEAVLVTESVIFSMAEEIYSHFENEAISNGIPINEYSCTLLGCYIAGGRAVFFQVGDGAIVRNDGTGFFIPVWWPHNGEYQNSTSFLVDDKAFSNLKVCVLEEQIEEIAIFTDGLQMLALNMETRHAHQPFFTGLFKYLRMADEEGKITILQRKATEYLGSEQINGRTDDDKTLFLATRVLI